MKILLDINSNTCLNYEDIVLLTRNALVDVNNVNFDKHKKVLIIPIKRENLIGFKHKTGFFSSELVPIYDHGKRIKSIIKISKIKSCKILNHCDDDESEITIMFGLNIKNNEISLISLEESRGILSYEINIKIDEIDIKIKDVVRQ